MELVVCQSLSEEQFTYERRSPFPIPVDYLGYRKAKDSPKMIVISNKTLFVWDTCTGEHGMALWETTLHNREVRDPRHLDTFSRAIAYMVHRSLN